MGFLAQSGQTMPRRETLVNSLAHPLEKVTGSSVVVSAGPRQVALEVLMNDRVRDAIELS